MSEKLTKNERRERAREQARLAREAEKRREKRGRFLLQGGIVLGVLAILAVVALILTQTMKPAGPGPENMASGGVVFTKDLKVVETPALQSGEDREAPEVDRKQLPLDVTTYVDYMCPACGAFEQQYGTMLENYVGSGDVNLQVYPLNFLDSASLGTKYSTRAANLFSCVVEQQPDVAFKLHNTLLSADVQPAERTAGLTDDQLLEQAEAAGAELTTELRQCVKDVRFGSFIAANYKAVSENGVQGLAKGAQLFDSNGTELQPAGEPQRLVSTPTVIVNGQQWNQARDGDLESYLLKVKSEVEKSAAKADSADASGDSADEGESE
ncbi:DsbA family protein [Leucobacter tenebrionis]|uniref:DsbA family protein n=1 Tax=Leucobacter tenebrionis TaxID=2873270 RepID=UPI001CA5F5D1|nr:thioredoxin domain-containing protein [Leucobacter tenebrionis]QZY52971.1 thioredoxin domain-containing protein [Leucobacter tenebrionis]